MGWIENVRGTGTKSLKHVLKLGVLTLFAAQSTAIGTILAIDEHRKRRHPQSGLFPYEKPHSFQLRETNITLFTYGGHLYEAQLKEIESAKKYIFFEMFIMKDDPIGHRFKEALIRAAIRGVEVYILIDSWGNLNQRRKFYRYPPLENLHVIRFPLIRPGILTGNPRQKGRDHRKILCIDGKVGFVGGYNIGKLYAGHWRDTHVRIAGPEVWELENTFVDMWNLYRSPKRQPELTDSGSGTWNPKLRALTNTPAFNSYPVRSAYLAAIDRSSHHIWITMGYFIPDDGLKRSLIQAARRGVDVRILVPQFSNHIVADWVSRPHYTELLQAGVRIFLYRHAMVHAKTMTADGQWSTVGTTNIDRLSMSGNFEVNLEIYGQQMASAMEAAFAVDMSNSRELTLRQWERRGFWPRLGEKILRPLGPLL